MKTALVSLYLRVRSADGGWTYARSVTTSNGRLRPQYAMVGGKPVYRSEGGYHLRYARNGKRVWESVGSDASLAQVAFDRKDVELKKAEVELQRKAVELKAAELGLAVRDAAAPIATPVPPPSAPGGPPRRLLHECIISYLAETKEHKSKRTYAAYKETIDLFISGLIEEHLVSKAQSDVSSRAEALKQSFKAVKQAQKFSRRQQPKNKRGRFSSPPPSSSSEKNVGESKIQELTAANNKALELFLDAADRSRIQDITRDDLLSYISFLRKRGNQPRTRRNRIDHFQIFLHHFGLPSILKGKNLPTYTEKKVRSYNGYELGLLFGQATLDESDLLHFLLCTGTREQEAQFACWSDVDLIAKTYTVTEHLELGYTPKDGEEGTLPIADILVNALLARRKRNPRTRLIFPGKNGKPNGHALRIIKRLALRVSVNCGHCVNKRGQSCATHPVCRHVILHKMRKTYATMLHWNGVPARTIMGYLRHSDLETTLRYLADGDDEQTREKINAAFGAYDQAERAA